MILSCKHYEVFDYSYNVALYNLAHRLWSRSNARFATGRQVLFIDLHYFCTITLPLFCKVSKFEGQ